MAGQKPDYTVSVYSRTSKARGTIGAAWKNDDDSITIKLNPCVVLDATSIEMGDIALTLWPAKFNAEGTRRRRELRAGGIGENEA